MVGALSLGCATHGPEILNETNFCASRENRGLTKEAIYAEMGQPHEVGYNASAKSAWMYYYRKSDELFGILSIPVGGVFSIQEVIVKLCFDQSSELEDCHLEQDLLFDSVLVKAIRDIGSDENVDTQRIQEEMKLIGVQFDEEKARRDNTMLQRLRVDTSACGGPDG